MSIKYSDVVIVKTLPANHHKRKGKAKLQIGHTMGLFTFHFPTVSLVVFV